MSQSGVILRRFAGKPIAEAWLKLAIAANPKGFGVAAVKDGAIMIGKGTDPTIELVNDTLAECDGDVTFYFCNSTSALSEDDISPYTILVKDKVPQLVAFVDGNFPGYAKKDSSHPGEFFIANEYLAQKLDAIYDLTGDLSKVMEFAKKPLFKKELLGNAVEHGNVTLVAANGDVVTFSVTDRAMEYTWGWVSHNYGYAIGPGNDKKEEPQKKGMFQGKSTVREKANTGSVVTPPPADIPPKSDAAVIKNYKVVKWSPAKNISRSQKKDEIRARIGYVPKNWQNTQTFDVYADGNNKVMTASEVKKLGLAVAALPKLHNEPPAGDRDGGDKQPEYVEQTPSTSVVKKVSDEVLPIMSPPTRDHIKKLMADTAVQKIIGDNAEIIGDPTKQKELEAKFSDFCAQLGMKSIDDFLCWSYPMMFDLARERPDGIAVMAWTFKNMLAGLRQERSTKKEEALPVQEEPKPVKRGMFGTKAA